MGENNVSLRKCKNLQRGQRGAPLPPLPPTCEAGKSDGVVLRFIVCCFCKTTRIPKALSMTIRFEFAMAFGGPGMCVLRVATENTVLFHKEQNHIHLKHQTFFFFLFALHSTPFPSPSLPSPPLSLSALFEDAMSPVALLLAGSVRTS